MFKDQSYDTLKNPFQIDILSISAIRSPELKDGEYANNDDLKIMDKKIESIFKLGIKNKYDSLVLGAFGCGSFSNPPEIVAQLFKKYTAKYGGHFHLIGFAILGKRHYDIFNHHLKTF